MENKDNISQFDTLFKDALHNHSVDAPSGLFQKIDTSISKGVAKSILIKKTIITLISATIAAGGLVLYNQISEKNNDLEKTNSSKNIITNEGLNPIANNIEQKNIQTLDNIKQNNLEEYHSKEAKKIKHFGLPNINMPDNESPFEENDYKSGKNLNPTYPSKDAEGSKQYEIIIIGKACVHQYITLNLANFNQEIVYWSINDELIQSDNQLRYLIEKEGIYDIKARYQNKIIAREKIVVNGVAAKVQKTSFTEETTVLKATISGYKNMFWTADGNIIGTDMKLIIDNKLYREMPYLVTTDINGCIDSFYAEDQTEAPRVHFSNQNIITPNEDGKNDYYDFEIANVFYYNLSIFDIKNNLVYTTNDPKNNWEGKNMITQNIAIDGLYFLRFSYQLTKNGDIQNKIIKLTLKKE